MANNDHAREQQYNTSVSREDKYAGMPLWQIMSQVKPAPPNTLEQQLEHVSVNNVQGSASDGERHDGRPPSRPEQAAASNGEKVEAEERTQRTFYQYVLDNRTAFGGRPHVQGSQPMAEGSVSIDNEHQRQESGETLATHKKDSGKNPGQENGIPVPKMSGYDEGDLGRRSQRGTGRSRSASPKPIENKTTVRSRSPLRQARRQVSHFEEQVARLDKETADYEAEYERLILEEKMQKRDRAKARLEELKRSMASWIPGIQDAQKHESPTPSDIQLASQQRSAREDGQETMISIKSKGPDKPEILEMPAALERRLNTPTGKLKAVITAMPTPKRNIAQGGPVLSNIPPSPGYIAKSGALISKGHLTDSNEAPRGVKQATRERGSGSMDYFQQRVLSTLAKGYAPRTGEGPAPRRTLSHLAATEKGGNRLFPETYGGCREQDLNLCRWVFDKNTKCPQGKDCECRHEPLNEEELEWIRTNPKRARGKKSDDPRKFLAKLLQNYSSHGMPEISKFDRL
ncbi:hypothetical protein N0V90_007070 [Kalmusia sp. IMI 367209]|nr:hypothetical protein N0V90_007070 [Kalmusia sp. IMI 367209]